MSEPELTQQAMTRLRRIEGQVRGIQGMLDRLDADPEAQQALLERVRALEAKGMARAEIAAELGMSQEEISDIECGRGTLDGEPCDSLLTQILAVRAAVEQVGLIIMELHLQRCVLEGVPMDEERRRVLRDSLKLWSRLSSAPR